MYHDLVQKTALLPIAHIPVTKTNDDIKIEIGLKNDSKSFFKFNFDV